MSLVYKEVQMEHRDAPLIDAAAPSLFDTASFGLG